MTFIINENLESELQSMFDDYYSRHKSKKRINPNNIRFISDYTEDEKKRLIEILKEHKSDLSRAILKCLNGEI